MLPHYKYIVIFDTNAQAVLNGDGRLSDEQRKPFEGKNKYD